MPERLWQLFLASGLYDFGDYQDAMARGEPYLCHACISAEGFLRQLIGWREYVRDIYWLRMP